MDENKVVLWKTAISANRFIDRIVDVKRVKMGSAHAIEFRYYATNYVLMDSGDLFMYDYSGRLIRCSANVYTRRNIATKYYIFTINAGYYRTGRKEIPAKDLLWAAFGDADVPKGWEVYPLDGNVDRIQINNLGIRRKS